MSLADDYLGRILRARVSDIAIETPLERIPRLSARLDNTVLLKREGLQPAFSFKVRGAYNKMRELERGAARGAASSPPRPATTRRASPWPGRALGIDALIVMPTTTPAIKVEAVRALGGRASCCTATPSTKRIGTRWRIATAEQRVFIHPYDDPDVIAGQGTIAAEILRQCAGPIDAIFVPVGGGGLIAGIAAYVKPLFPEVRIIGVEPDDSSCLHAALAAGERVDARLAYRCSPTASPSGRSAPSPSASPASASTR